MESLIGGGKVTLDDKGRLSLPASLRSSLAGVSLILTQGADDCLWLYPPDEWKVLLQTIMDTTSPFDAHSRIVRRRIVGPAQEVELDGSGRLPVPQSLREFAGLSREHMVLVLGQVDYVEIWSEDRYHAYSEANEDKANQSFKELGDLIRQKKALMSGKASG